MGHHQGAPMPASIRHAFRARAHPARSVPCPHEPCHARAHQACRVAVNGRLLKDVHPARKSKWAVTTACCPECQVQPGIPCHDNSIPRADVHPRRIQEAEATLA